MVKPDVMEGCHQRCFLSTRFLTSGTPGVNTGVSHQKVAMSLMSGIDMGPVRFPLLQMEQKHALELAKDLKSLGIEKFHN